MADGMANRVQLWARRQKAQIKTNRPHWRRGARARVHRFFTNAGFSKRMVAVAGLAATVFGLTYALHRPSGMLTAVITLSFVVAGLIFAVYRLTSEIDAEHLKEVEALLVLCDGNIGRHQPSGLSNLPSPHQHWLRRHHRYEAKLLRKYDSLTARVNGARDRLGRRFDDEFLAKGLQEEQIVKAPIWQTLLNRANNDMLAPPPDLRIETKPGFPGLYFWEGYELAGGRPTIFTDGDGDADVVTKRQQMFEEFVPECLAWPEAQEYANLMKEQREMVGFVRREIQATLRNTRKPLRHCRDC